MVATCSEHGIGELYSQGDHACACGDLEALAAIAEHLIEHASEPLHCELVPLARRCSDPELATDAWAQLKRRVQA